MTTAPEQSPATIADLEARALRIRRHVVRMAAGKGEGYVGQGLQAADLLSALFFSEMRFSSSPGSDDDRFFLSTGHYSIALWAAFAELGLIEESALDTYGEDGSSLPMSTERGQPGVELTGGSLAQGLGVAAGLALGRRMRGEGGRVFNYMTDGEIQEGSTWEAAMFAADKGLDNLVNVVDVNRTQADGPLVLEIEPLAAKFSAFGWEVVEADGNDIEAILSALDRLRGSAGRPKVGVFSTRIGMGVPLLMERERAHFVRVEASEWELVKSQLEEPGNAA